MVGFCFCTFLVTLGGRDGAEIVGDAIDDVIGEATEYETAVLVE